MAVPARGATFYVDGANPVASDSNAGTAAAPYKTISAAIAARGAAGNIVFVKPATYRETVTLGVSGAAGNPFVIRATAPGVIVDGADDFAATAKWTLVSGNIYLASSVNWAPVQVFADGARLAPSTAAVTALPSRTFRYVSGTGLYVNVGGGSPATHATLVGRRAYGVRLSGRSWIVIEGLEVLRTEDRAIYLSNASNNATILRNSARFSSKYGIYVTGCSAATIDSNLVADNQDHGLYLASATTGCLVRGNEVARNVKPDLSSTHGIYVNASPNNRFERNRVHDNRGSGLYFYGGATGTLSIYDRSWANGESGFRIAGSTGARILGGVAHGNAQRGFSLEGASTGATIHNCIGTDNGLGSSGFDFVVESGAASGLSSNYNVWWNSTAQAPLLFGSTTCTTIAAFRTASAQDARSTQADPKFVSTAAADFHLKAGSPAIDAANAGVANWPATDAEGVARFDDATTANTGAGTPAYSDRGAFEFKNAASPPVARLSATPTTGVAPLLVTLSASATTDADGGALSYRFNFGDGTTAGPQSTPTITHTYVRGSWTATVTVTDNTGLTGTATATVTPNAKPVAALTATPATGPAPLLVTLNASGSTDADGGALSYSFNFGDGSSAAPQATPNITHSYAVGTWVASVTVRDNTGLTSTATANVAPFQGNQLPIPAIALTYRAPGMITDPDTIFEVPVVARPPYMTSQLEPTFGSPMRRIIGDAGTTFALPGGATGTWGQDARHHYSKDQPWNSDGSLIMIDNNGGTPIELFLDGKNYNVVKGRCSNYISGDDRWHPSPAYPNVRINTNNFELMWFDVVNCVKTRSWTLPFEVQAIGMGEGNPSNDGRFLALSDGVRVFVVDMDPQAPLAPYPSQRIGPALDVSNCGLSDGCGIGFVSVSASGKYVVVKYLNDHPRVFDIDPVTLALTPHALPESAHICSEGSPAEGWIFDLGHPDLALNPFDGNEDVMIGQQHCGGGTKIDGKNVGGVVMVRLRDGAVTSLTDPDNEAQPHHISTRNLRRPGWVYVDYFPEPGARFNDEIVAIKMDGSNAVQRFAHKHTVSPGCYRCESHAVPSLDGRRMLWASNWTGNCVACGSPTDIRAYVVDATKMFVPDTSHKQNVMLDASASRDPDGTIASYRFLYGDGAAFGPAAENAKSHDYRAGTWRSSVTVTDNVAAKDSVIAMITIPPVNRAPNGVITKPATDVTIAVGQSLELAGSASDPDGSAGLRFLWDLGGASGVSYFTKSPGLVPFNRVGTFVVRFLATDVLNLDDPTPDSVTVIVTPANGRAPIVSAPATISGTELRTIVVNVTAADLDGDLITSLIADVSGLPEGHGATFVVNATNTAGTLTWTPSPTAGRAAPYAVTFTAANAQSGSATTSFAVQDGVGPNLVANPSFEFNSTGWGPSGNATNVRVPGGQSGSYSLRSTGSATPGMFGVNDSPNAVTLTLAAGTRYRFTAWVKAAGPAGYGRIRVREYVGGVQLGPIVYSTAAPLTLQWQMLSVDFVAAATGSVLDFQVLDDPIAVGESFFIDNVSVVIVPPAAGEADARPGTTDAAGAEIAGGDVADVSASAASANAFDLAPLAASISPHPVSGSSTIRFATSRRGPLRLTLLDLSGRRVRTLLDQTDAPAGMHHAVFTRRGGEGSTLAAGVYFWRIEAGEGVSGGRLVVLE